MKVNQKNALPIGVFGVVLAFLLSPIYDLATNAYDSNPLSIKICHEIDSLNLRIALTCKANEEDLVYQLIGPEGPRGLGFADTFSYSDNDVSLGEKKFAVKEVGAFAIGMRTRIIAQTGPYTVTESLIACPIAYIEGTITDIVGREITVNIDSFIGEGAFNSWKFTIAGNVGATGATGATGAKGDKGDKGETGAQGPAGASGASGATGSTGAAGSNGTNGANGTDGLNGITIPGDFGNFLSTQSQSMPSPVSPTAVFYDANPVEASGVYTDGSKIKFSKNGEYNIAFSFQLMDTGNVIKDSTIDIWLRKNGENVENSNTTVHLGKNNVKYVAAWNFFAKVDNFSNDFYEIVWYSSNSTNAIIYFPAETSPAIPAIPSVIMTVNQVGC